MSSSLQPNGPKPARLLCPWNSPGQNIGVGSLSLLQGIFPNLGSNPGLPHCRQILYQLSHQGSPRILEWVAYPFFRRSFRPRIQIAVSALQAGSLPAELPGIVSVICGISKEKVKVIETEWDGGIGNKERLVRVQIIVIM